MNRRGIFILLFLGLLGICAYLGRSVLNPGGASTNVPTQETEPPATTQAVTTEAPSTEPPATEPPIQSPTPVVFPPPEAPAVPSGDKLSLPFSQPLPQIQQNELGTAVGFSFPSGISGAAVALKVAPLLEIKPAPDGLTLVGVVEIGGAGQVDPGMYTVNIDLNSTESLVEGRIDPVGFSSPLQVMFRRTPQIPNPERFKSIYEEFAGLGEPPDSAVAISANSLCFVIKSDPSNNQNQEVAFTRYCSDPGSPLSVRTSFESQHAALQQLMGDVAARFDLQDVVLVDQSISEMESPVNIKTCAARIQQTSNENPTAEPVGTETVTPESPTAPPQEGLEDCTSDITLAPVTRAFFEEQLQQNNPASTPTGTGGLFRFTSFSMPVLQDDVPFSVKVAVVRVHKEITTELEPVSPGLYTLYYWFKGKDENGDDRFYAATISGFKLDQEGNEIGEVVDQPVPAVPSTFVDDPDIVVVEEEVDAQISACRILRRCTFFQRTCT